MSKELPDPPALTEEEWAEFVGLSERSPINDTDLARWTELARKARVRAEADDAAHNADWEAFSALCPKRYELEPEEFGRLLKLSKRFSPIEAYSRFEEEFRQKRIGLVLKSGLGIFLALFVLLIGQLLLMDYDSGRRSDKERAMAATLAALFPGSKPECFAREEKSLPILEIATEFSYICHFGDLGEGATAPGTEIDLVRVEGSTAICYKHKVVLETYKQWTDGVEVKRLAVDPP